MLELKLVTSDVIILFTAAVLGTAFYNAYQHMPASSEADEDEREGGQDEDDINEETENEINRQIQFDWKEENIDGPLDENLIIGRYTYSRGENIEQMFEFLQVPYWKRVILWVFPVKCRLMKLASGKWKYIFSYGAFSHLHKHWNFDMGHHKMLQAPFSDLELEYFVSTKGSNRSIIEERVFTNAGVVQVIRIAEKPDLSCTLYWTRD
ncbi:uncharacterized protein LOC111700724 isoform X2 [Eurytemora carolleeae]|uniref:uncharacterized protein LOC111700724 isoform X2 n=1 Tax=Eurytemora carolleeae TaxID=1294199 RepID=UPI000C789429|nr:uncharacterized protein LOC111700724 isoform X2 [Eurytemora carolleeae]|eukprot:XP_023327505.1 uncharacterized protein LOC111700724 isoform X2 [Eurytemora affinis]